MELSARVALEALLDLLAPPGCSACGARGAVGPVCDRCARALAALDAIVEPGPTGVDLACAAGGYEGVVRDLVTGLKLGRRRRLARPAAAAIARSCPPEELRGAIVPVPPAPLRLRWRGFDPADELATALSALTGLAVEPALRRAGGPRQARRPRHARLADPPRVRCVGAAPASALLVDDVRTTGATLSACAAALRAGGCGRVVALTLARTAPAPVPRLGRTP